MPKAHHADVAALSAADAAKAETKALPRKKITDPYIYKFAIGKFEGTPRAEQLNRAHLALQALLLVILGYLALDALSGNGWLPGAWFGAKLLLFALIFALGIGIDFAFRPIGPAFVQLATEGSSPALEARITAAVDGAIRYVLGLYALLIGIAFLGITKPF